MQNFLDAIAGAAEPLNSARDAVLLMEMLDAVYTSGATGREVPCLGRRWNPGFVLPRAIPYEIPECGRILRTQRISSIAN